MDVPLFQVDAFVDDTPFSGNPAAIVLLPADRPWPSDEVLQGVAIENNLSETAFLHPHLPSDAGATGAGAAGAKAAVTYHLRWFTPGVEVDLCGHATLAAAAVLFDDVHPGETRLDFWTRSGWLTASQPASGAVSLDFPAATLQKATVDPALLKAVGVIPEATLQATDVVLVLASADEVRSCTPDLAALAGLDVRGVVITAPGRDDGVDVVSRFFGAGAGIGEDPVTGSAHSQFARYWCDRLGRTSFVARQLSPRGGTVAVVLVGERVQLTGRYRRYLEGIAHLPS